MIVHSPNRLLKVVFATLKSRYRPATIYLKNGHKFQGHVLQFDDHAVLIERNVCHQVVLLDSIASVSYDTNITLSYGAEDALATTCD